MLLLFFFVVFRKATESDSGVVFAASVAALRLYNPAMLKITSRMEPGDTESESEYEYLERTSAPSDEYKKLFRRAIEVGALEHVSAMIARALG